ncbi:MAG: hypothetical protein DYH13_05515 [Alphaproteobacteria bacterium PRO2]|nr:hypothetical protein [Alphaproteobacteria bacterium PRO2]
MKIRLLSSVCLFAVCAAIPSVHAQENPANSASDAQKPVPREAMIGLARDFVKRISKGFQKADKALQPKVTEEDIAARLPEGEELLLNIRLTDRMLLESQMLSKVQNKQIVLSLRDFFAVLELPITLDAETGAASGWYIRENKLFNMDFANRTVKTDNGEFRLSDDVTQADGEVYVPINELAAWFGFQMSLRMSALELKLETPVPLPIQERLERHKRDLRNRKIGPPVLPLQADANKMLEIPVVDVLTRSSYSRPGEGDPTLKSQMSVGTAGDFAKGTLTTQTNFDREEKLTSARVKYTKQSLEPELLGPLNARKFELGDVSSVRMPLDNKGAVETGVRVTNVHPLRASIRPETTITGTAFPGWDIELYRDKQMLAFQTVGEDGIYTFDNVSLFRSDNNFRIVMYGLQGEIREEELYVPVDNTRLSEQGSVYDVSLSVQETNTYKKQGTDDVDEGAPHLAAIYEFPVGDLSAISTGVESKEVGGERISSAQAGYSTEIAQTLFNLDGAVDTNSEMGARLTARRDFGQHKLRNEINWATEGYDLLEDQTSRDIFSENFGIYGPLPLPLGIKPRYNFNFDYSKSSDDLQSASVLAGVSTSWRFFSLDQQFEYSFGFDGRGDTMGSITTLKASRGRNRFELTAHSDIKPIKELNTLEANWTRRINRNLQTQLGIEREIKSQHTAAVAQLDWDAGHARISPAVSYNTEQDFVASLTTRFGVAKDPLRDKMIMYSTPSITAGGLSVFVFLDQNGDGVYNEGEEPIPGARVQSLQTGGRQETSEEGYAFFPSLKEMQRTDVFIDPESLQDPFWVPGTEGVSILPRSGHIAELQFPVHNAGEVDGTLYVRKEGEEVSALNGVRLALYNAGGDMKVSSVTAADGYFLFSKIPPGEYTLVINSDDAAANKFVRPEEPDKIVIGFDGTMIYGHDIHVMPGHDVATVVLAEIPAHAPSNADLLKPGAVIINLGDYNSRLLMGLTWYRLRMQYANVIGGAVPLIPSTASQESPKTGKHTLRVVIAGDTQKKAVERCKAIAQAGFKCSVEILPEKMKMASAG